jgi:dTDP-4-amino-4,6-dideoxygalactose transaminase
MKKAGQEKAVPFVDLAVPTEQVRARYVAAVDRLLAGHNFILTREVDDFEKAWARAVGARWAVGVSSGSDALYLALRALDVGAGDEVITQGNAYNASVVAIMRAGAVPRFADIDPATWRMDPSLIESLITARTKAIMPVHLFGQPCDMASVMKIARRYKLRVVEDCAQSHGAAFGGHVSGAWGDIGAFSFYPTKNLGAFGDAGALTTDDPGLYARLKILRNLGQDGKDNHVEYGSNMRLDAMQALALNLKLKYLPAATRARAAAAARDDRQIAHIRPPVIPAGRDARATHAHHLYPVLAAPGARDAVRAFLADNGIQTGVHYPVPVYRQPFFSMPHDPCPVTDDVVSRIFSLPFYHGIAPGDQTYVIETLKKFIR